MKKGGGRGERESMYVYMYVSQTNRQLCLRKRKLKMMTDRQTRRINRNDEIFGGYRFYVRMPVFKLKLLRFFKTYLYCSF